jgi:hypothetical protein
MKTNEELMIARYTRDLIRSEKISARLTIGYNNLFDISDLPEALRHGYQADNWHSSRHWRGISDRLFRPLCGNFLRTYLQSLVGDDPWRSDRISADSSIS